MNLATYSKEVDLTFRYRAVPIRSLRWGYQNQKERHTGAESDRDDLASFSGVRRRTRTEIDTHRVTVVQGDRFKRHFGDERQFKQVGGLERTRLTDRYL